MSAFRLSLGILLAVSFVAQTAIASEQSSQHTSADLSHHHKHHLKSEHKRHAPEVKHSIVINAKPEHVWQAIQHQRKADDHRKLLSYDGNAATLHETFAALPIVGEASCDYVETESTLFERIDYSMVKSDHFAVFEGAWLISPGKDGTTNVELSNAIDPGIRVPFWQDITKLAASRLVKRRLDAVCAYAEHLQKDESSRVR